MGLEAGVNEEERWFNEPSMGLRWPDPHSGVVKAMG